MVAFSIIIPIYNVMPYIRECLDSVLAQTFSDWEAVCVDDGSTDDSGIILDEYAAKDKRFVVIHQPNTGVSVARNTAMKVANGEWVTFLDGDDKIDPGRLQALSAIISMREGIDWIHETRNATNINGTRLAVESECEYVTSSVLLDGWRVLKENALLCLNTYKRANIASVQFPPGVRYAEDDIFELRCLSNCKCLAVVGYCGYWYRVNRIDSASRRIEVEDSVKVHRLLLETAESQKNNIDKIAGNEQFITLFTQTVRKDFDRVFRQFWRAPYGVQEEHRAISHKIYQSPYFSVKYAEPYIIGYWIYLKTGWLLPMAIQDLCKRALSRVLRCVKKLLGKQRCNLE